MARAEEKERQQRLQRMLAREQGREYTPPPEPAPAKRRRSRPRPTPVRDNIRPFRPIQRRRRRRRLLTVVVLALVFVLAFALLNGALNGVGRFLGDTVDNILLNFGASEGWPVDTGISAPQRAEPLADGFVVMDSEDVAIFTAGGTRVRTIQPGYGRPCLAVGNTRFVLYNRSGTELRMESRTETLYTRTYEKGILLCALAGNGSLAVVTQDDRYAAVLEVLDPSQNPLITYSLAQDDGVPVALSFASDNKRFALGAVIAEGGRMRSLVYLMDIRQAVIGPCYRADAGSLVLELHWLSGNRVLAVLDTCAVLLDKDGGEVARYDYGGAVLQDVSVTGRQTALLLSSRAGNTLVTLNDALSVLSTVTAGEAISVATTETDVYLLTDDTVLCYGYDGEQRWRKTLDVRPQAVLNARRTLLLAGGAAEPLHPPE